MASKYTTFQSKESVKARKVTAKEGESVVTTNGPVLVPKGDYVVQSPDGIRHVEGVDFERRYNTRKGGKKTTNAQKRAATTKKAASKK